MSGELTEEQVREIADAINARSRNPNDPCPNCGEEVSEVVGYTGRVAFDYRSDGPAVALPTVSTVCSHCGFVRQFAARQLGLSFDVWSIDDRKQNG